MFLRVRNPVGRRPWFSNSWAMLLGLEEELRMGAFGPEMSPERGRGVGEFQLSSG